MLFPAIWGYYWGSLVPRCWSLVSLKWLPVAAGIFCSACDSFGSKWNNWAEDKPLKGCWHIICFTEIQTVICRMQQQNSHQPDQGAFIYELIHKLGEKRWISPTLASSQSSSTGDIPINQPQSHLQKGSILTAKQHLHRAVNLKCALRK